MDSSDSPSLSSEESSRIEKRFGMAKSWSVGRQERGCYEEAGNDLVVAPLCELGR